MININGIPGRTALVNGRTYLFFSGFAYLGMPSLDSFRKIVAEGIQRHGVVFPSSRISNTRSRLYNELEDQLSLYLGLPASASFSSGYLAARAAVQAVASNSKIIYAPGIHPSLRLEGVGEKTPADDQWHRKVTERINGEKGTFFTVVMESVNPLSGEVQDLSWLENIEAPVQVLIDDSHGIGLLGEKGTGMISLLPASPLINPVICYSLSKAFSCEGGGVSGSEAIIGRVRNTPFYTASTPMSPAFAYAWMQARPLFEQQRRALAHNVSYWLQKIRNSPLLKQDPRLPVCRIPAEGVYEHCLQYHILLSAFRYPSEKDPLSSRIVLNALHQKEDIERLADCLASFPRTA